MILWNGVDSFFSRKGAKAQSGVIIFEDRTSRCCRYETHQRCDLACEWPCLLVVRFVAAAPTAPHNIKKLSEQRAA